MPLKNGLGMNLKWVNAIFYTCFLKFCQISLSSSTLTILAPLQLPCCTAKTHSHIAIFAIGQNSFYSLKSEICLWFPDKLALLLIFHCYRSKKQSKPSNQNPQHIETMISLRYSYVVTGRDNILMICRLYDFTD